MEYPKILLDLIECYKKLPGIGAKSAERMALSTMNLDQEVLDLFSSSIKDIKEKVKRCSICGNYSDGDLCSICSSKSRDKSIVCVVEEPKNIILIERIGTFNGVYHVLNGLISPLDGINPNQITINQLVNRVNKEEITEIIFALKPSIEGETTCKYIKKILEDKDIVFTKIAHGVPMGADIDYIDTLTLEMALDDRKIMD